MWFDTHCHLHDIEDRDDALDRARSAGIVGLVSLAVDEDTSHSNAELTARDGVWSGAGWHPTSVKGWEAAWADPIDELLENEKVVAVGESGIDLYWDKTYLPDQVAAFKAHIGLAKRHDKPLVIHTRDSIDETLEVIDTERPPQRFVFHCWSGTPEQLERVLSLGGMVSFAGNVSFKSAEPLREAARLVPADRLMVETDSPYLAPVPKRGKPNEPAFVAHVGAAVAAARGVSEEELAASTTANARAFFGL